MTARKEKWDATAGKHLGVTGKTMGKSFRRAEKSYDKLKDKKHVKDKWAYISGTAQKIAKNKAKAEDLIALGIAPATVIEVQYIAGSVEQAENLDPVFGAVFIAEVLKLESGQPSALLEKDTFEPTDELSSLLTEDIAGTNSLTRWRKLLPQCPEFLIKYLAQTT